jgi:hypothetical protein
LYWQEIPPEVKAWDDFNEVKMSLPKKFVMRIDASTQKQKLTFPNAYSAHFRWSNPAEGAGSPRDIAEVFYLELATAF